MSVKIIDIENQNEWLLYRGTGIGASEAAVLFGLSPFKSALELFYEKVGFSPKQFYSLRMLYGSETENLNSRLVACYNGNDEDHAMNVTKNITFRDVLKFPAHSYFRNDKYPEIFASPDRHVSIGGVNGFLEAKDTSSLYLKHFVDNVSPINIFQLKTQLMVGERPFGILSYIIDGGRGYKERRYERDGTVFNDAARGVIITEKELADRAGEFWAKVLVAREASELKRQAKLARDYESVATYDAIIEQAEPEPDSTLSYEAFVNEKYLSIDRPLVELKGTAKHEKVAEKFIKLKEARKIAESEFQNVRNEILAVCKPGNKIKLSGKGYIQVASGKTMTLITVKP